jgi:hypothetical protein
MFFVDLSYNYKIVAPLCIFRNYIIPLLRWRELPNKLNMTITFPTPTIAHLESNDILHDAQEAAELLMNCLYQGADSLIIREENLPAAFFDLKTGLAGDILQKFSTYNGRLAIIGDFSKYESKSLRDFMYESNKGRRINFVGGFEEAVNVLSGK